MPCASHHCRASTAVVALAETLGLKEGLPLFEGEMLRLTVTERAVVREADALPLPLRATLRVVLPRAAGVRLTEALRLRERLPLGETAGLPLPLFAREGEREPLLLRAG